MITAIGDVMREAYKRNWITTRDGNCALKKRGSKKIYMTPSGVRKNIIYPESIMHIIMKEDSMDIKSKNNSTLTGEWEMHYNVLKNLKTTACTLHLHPPHIVAAMHAGWELSDLVKPFPEVFRYTRVGKNVDDFPALSKELAEHTSKNIIKDNKIAFDIVGQKSHGVCSIGKNPWDAFEHIERVEHIAQIVLLSGAKPKTNETKSFKDILLKKIRWQKNYKNIFNNMSPAEIEFIIFLTTILLVIVIYILSLIEEKMNISRLELRKIIQEASGVDQTFRHPGVTGLPKLQKVDDYETDINYYESRRDEDFEAMRAEAEDALDRIIGAGISSEALIGKIRREPALRGYRFEDVMNMIDSIDSKDRISGFLGVQSEF